MSAMDILVACGVVVALLVLAGRDALREVWEDFFGVVGRAHAGRPVVARTREELEAVYEASPDWRVAG